MIVPQTYKCDICGTQRGETNHWLVVRVDNGIHLYTWDQAKDLDYLDGRVSHFCGQTHALQFVSSEMGAK